ncbi:MAG TPA: 3-hydroxyacyl-CoA dehydrogenase NAD-binding domain-containing protein, partial [Thermoanaerobaculia bacterium]|nr:3-hydroxyacyl-CoA dehydrogenase NAD-binding domain-containing protein [Thermoanaerobaculia bacterium]
MTAIGRIGVVGAGTMGHGIAQVAVQSGYEVLLADTVPEALERGVAQVAKGLARLVDKGKLAADARDQALSRLEPAADLTGFARVDLAVEAVVERLEVKQAVLAELDRVCPSHAILATNTSSISITRLAAATRRPPQVIGMHFMNPVPLMQLVEVIRGLATAQATYDAVEEAA